MTSTQLPPASVPDPVAIEAFAERMLTVINDGCLAILTSVGHRLGLYDTLAALPPATSAEIAAAAGLEERYVREWLSGQATGGIVHFDATTRRWSLPAAHAACLTSDAGLNDLAHMTQFIPLLAGVEDAVVECFREGGGVGYSAYGDFHRLMAESSAKVHDAVLLDVVIPLAPELPERLAAGIDVADLGCGSGHALNLLAQAHPASRFVGYDFSEEAVGAARREAAALGLANARFEVRDVAELEGESRFDLITAFDAIHDQAQPARVLEHAARLLRTDGVFLMVDVQASSDLAANLDHPFGTFGYAVSTLHCMTVSLGLEGAGLGTFWGEELAQRMLADAGFGAVELLHLPSDIWHAYYIARR